MSFEDDTEEDGRGHIKIQMGNFRFSSQFDSGNLVNVKPGNTDSDFNLYVYGGPGDTKYRTWFHFSVSGGRPGQTLTIRISNMSNHRTLFAQGHRPVYRSHPQMAVYKRLPTPVQFQNNVDKNGRSRLTFEYTFEEGDRKVFFALCYPYSYKDLLNEVGQLECENLSVGQAVHGKTFHGWKAAAIKSINRDGSFDLEFGHGARGCKWRPGNIRPPEQFAKTTAQGGTGIYYHRTLLGFSLEQRRIDLLTISSYKDALEEREPLPDMMDIFPAGHRARQFPRRKKLVVISARVHPGETMASLLMSGIMRFLLDQDDARAEALRKNFVFKIIPMLNPDGVYRGHWRSNLNGLNLNRFYHDPNNQEHEGAYSSKELVTDLNKRYKISYFFDLHAHVVNKGVFIYGNDLRLEEKVLNLAYCRAFKFNAKQVNFDKCDFVNKANKEDMQGLSRKGSARYVMHQITKATHTYTVEVNVNTWLDKRKKEEAVDFNDRIQEQESHFSPSVCQDVGIGMLLAILDVEELNPEPTIPKKYRSLAKLKESVMDHARWQHQRSETMRQENDGTL